MLKNKYWLETSYLFVLSIFISSLALSSKTAAAQNGPASSPNIVLIYMDDMGYGDLGVTGAWGYQTPNFDKMASEGMFFTNFYTVSPVCSASRMALMTGAYPNRVGVTGALFPNSQTGINHEEETIAELLKAGGYATSIIGKWHLGDAEKFLPLQHGFDEFFGLPYSNDMWAINYDGTPATDPSSFHASMPPLPLIRGNNVIEYIENMADQDELTTRFTEEAVDFIGRYSDTPFFLYIAHSMPHVPLGVSDKFKGKSEHGLYGDVMMELDWSTGEVVNALKNNEILNNTLVIVTSDNGPWLNFGNHAGSAGGFKEGKQTVWEGGVRVPAIMYWPDGIAAGTVNNSLTATIDILPTLVSLTGVRSPSKRIDGVNIASLLQEETHEKPRDHIFFYYNENDLQAVLKDHWKLILPHQWYTYEDELPGQDGLQGNRNLKHTEMALFDLRRDPGERYNVLEQNPDVVTELLKLADEIRKDLGDNLTDSKGENRREPGRL